MIESRTTAKFWRLFQDLSPEVRQEAVRAYRQFRDNPSHPGPHFKKLEGTGDTYSVRIGLDYRATGVRKMNRVVWFWIGSHAEFDRLF